MNKYGRQHLVNYLNNHCESKYLRSLVLKYYDKLVEQNAVIFLDRIENIYINSGDEVLEIEPDVVNKLSLKNNKNNQISLQEFFVFQLVNYIQNITFKDNCKFSGYVDLTKNEIFVKKTSRASLKNSIVNNPKFNRYNTNEVVSNLLNENYRHILFHELTHLLEMKFYADGMLVNVGMENRCILRRKNEIFVIDKNNGLNNYSEEYEDFNILKNQGALLMSELFNELYTAQIAQWDLRIEKTPLKIKEKYGLDEYLVYPLKYGSIVESEYLKLYRVFEFLTDFTECQFNFNDMRLNANSFVYVVNNILPQSNLKEIIPVIQEGIKTTIPPDVSLFDLICFNLGVVNYGTKNNNDKIIKAGMAFNEQLFEHINKVIECKQNKAGENNLEACAEKISTKKQLTQVGCTKSVSGLEK